MAFQGRIWNISRRASTLLADTGWLMDEGRFSSERRLHADPKTLTIYFTRF